MRVSNPPLFLLVSSSNAARIIRVHDEAGPDGHHRYGVLIKAISNEDAASLKDCIYLSRWMNEKTGNL